MAQKDDLSNLKTPAVWRSAVGDVPFPSDTSLDWFLRKYQTELRAAGAIVTINRRKYLVPGRFESLVLKIALAETNK
jgi:hypothetical protein